MTGTTNTAAGGQGHALAKRLREACAGHPVAEIRWPHRLLHEAADVHDELLDALCDALVFIEDAFDDEVTGRQAKKCSAKVRAAIAKATASRTEDHQTTAQRE